MNPELYLVRPFADADFELMSRLFSLENPEDPTTEEDQRHFEQTFSAPHFFRKKWTVEDRRTGKSVAVGILAHSPFQYHPRKFWAMVIVDPDHRGRGVGRALSALIDAEAVSLQAECLWLTIRRDDLRSMDFTQKQGFLELRRLWLSSLEVPRANLPMDSDRGTALEREGIRFATLAEEGPESSEVRHLLFDLFAEVARDIPRLGEHSPISFEEFVGMNLEGPGFFPEGIFLARDRDAYVAVSTLELNPVRPDVLRVGFTGTRAPYRGRGIATELKRRALEYAQRQGIQYLWTMNDSLNLPIWAINEKQGFRRSMEWSSQERQLSSGASAPGSSPEG